MPEGRSILSRLRLPFRHSRFGPHNTASSQNDNALFHSVLISRRRHSVGFIVREKPERYVIHLRWRMPRKVPMNGRFANGTDR